MAPMEVPVYPDPAKRLIICCDGTWQDSDTGYDKPTFWNPIGRLQIPSNVTRISRAFKRECRDGKTQVISYLSGVGSGGTTLDILTGGAFGMGIAENIRAAYAFICANYCDGDEIVLVGFSRGAFTARSVAGMIGDLGLLTREGMEYFYPVFKDMQNWRTKHYKDPFRGMPFDDKPRGEGAEEIYREKLLERGLTRVYQANGDLITVKAVAVWDTVGSLGIPNISWLQKLGIPHSTKEFSWYDTNLSDRIEHAFQALALDEHRPPFSPAVWERTANNKQTTDLRQVWFPGNHGNIGGGWADAGVANMSLAWMMDQLASVGVEFDEATITRIFTRLERYYRETGGHSTKYRKTPVAYQTDSDSSTHGSEVERSTGCCGIGSLSPQWAVEPIYENNVPVRPWGLGALLSDTNFLMKLAGHITRTPGEYKKVKPSTGAEIPNEPLDDTNERIHSSVRVRVAAGGLGLNDKKRWDFPALKRRWRLTKTTEDFRDPIPSDVLTWEPKEAIAIPGSIAARAAELQQPLEFQPKGERWVYVWRGRVKKGASPPPERIMVEERLGPYERQLMRLAGGEPNVYHFAEQMFPRIS